MIARLASSLKLRFIARLRLRHRFGERLVNVDVAEVEQIVVC